MDDVQSGTIVKLILVRREQVEGEVRTVRGKLPFKMSAAEFKKRNLAFKQKVTFSMVPEKNMFGLTGTRYEAVDLQPSGG